MSSKKTPQKEAPDRRFNSLSSVLSTPPARSEPEPAAPEPEPAAETPDQAAGSQPAEPPESGPKQDTAPQEQDAPAGTAGEGSDTRSAPAPQPEAAAGSASPEPQKGAQHLAAVPDQPHQPPQEASQQTGGIAFQSQEQHEPTAATSSSLSPSASSTSTKGKAADSPRRARSSRPSQPQPQAESAEGDERANLAFYLPETLHNTLRDRSNAARRSQVQLLLDAIEAHYDDIPTVLRDRHTAKPQASGGLFRRPGRTDTIGGGPTVNMRVPQDTLTTIDQLASAADAHSRSEYIRVALELHFG